MCLGSYSVHYRSFDFPGPFSAHRCFVNFVRAIHKPIFCDTCCFWPFLGPYSRHFFLFVWLFEMFHVRSRSVFIIIFYLSRSIFILLGSFLVHYYSYYYFCLVQTIDMCLGCVSGAFQMRFRSLQLGPATGQTRKDRRRQTPRWSCQSSRQHSCMSKTLS